MENNKNNGKFFYGWLIVVGCMLIQAVPYSLAANIQPAFTKYVTTGEGFTLTQFFSNIYYWYYCISFMFSFYRKIIF